MNLSSTARQIVFWLLIIAGAFCFISWLIPRQTSKPVALTAMDEMIQSGNLKSING